jgi:cysteine synthase/rhodanese-related sulfurtransferase
VLIYIALNMLREVQADKTKRIVEYSSGSTVISMGVLSRVLHGIDDVHAYLSNKTSVAKLQLMQFFGLNITLFGGPSQPEPCDPRGGIQVARAEARATISSDGRPGSTFNANQYENDRNWKAHCKWTGPQILKQLPEINLICIGMGTSGTMTGNGQFFKEHKPSVTRLGICTAAGQRVPGPRSRALMAPVLFPWKDAVDAVEEVGEEPSYRLSMQLSREGLVCGPSSGFNLQGIYQFLEKKKADGGLQSMKDERGELHCVFLCCDLPYQYMGEYFSKLGAELFPPIHNEQLAQVDLFRYDEAWELDSKAALEHQNYRDGPESTKVERVLLDLRQPEDFATAHLSEAVSVPIQTLQSDTPSPFHEPRVLEAQWTEINRIFAEDAPALSELRGKRVYLICYNGDTSRTASSILRARGVEAFSLRGGWSEAQRLRPQPLRRPVGGCPPEINTEGGLQVDRYTLRSPYTPLVSPSAIASIAG